MFDTLTSSLSSALKSLSGRGRLTDDNISDTVREVRLALLDADVALSVVKTFTDAVKARAIGVEVTKSLTPGQAFIKVVHEELTRLMGEPSGGLNLRAQRPVVVMLAGLQGAGKTTSAGKLARWLIEKQNKKVLMVSTDVYRPAAILQLQTLAAQVGAGFSASLASELPVTIAKRALTEAALQAYDVLLLDTAGRLHIDAEMMAEVKELEAAINPHERLFVVDSMAGQDAVNAAKAFNDALSLTGVILTKADGDARGGAALSVRQVTGKPILFVGTGGNAALAGAIDQLRAPALPRRHRVDDSHLTLQALRIDRTGRRRGIGLHLRRQLVQQRRHAAHVLQLAQLVA